MFETTESTLTKVDCYFAALFRGSYASAGEEEGICGGENPSCGSSRSSCGCRAPVREFFIDRDPTHFRFILNFLRDGVVVMPHSQEALVREVLVLPPPVAPLGSLAACCPRAAVSPPAQEEIAREAHFYQLGHLERLVRKRLAELRAEESARPSHEREFKVLRHVPESNLEVRARSPAIRRGVATMELMGGGALTCSRRPPRAQSRVRELAEQGYDFVSGLPSSSAGNLHLVFACVNGRQRGAAASTRRATLADVRPCR